MCIPDLVEPLDAQSDTRKTRLKIVVFFSSFIYSVLFLFAFGFTYSLKQCGCYLPSGLLKIGDFACPLTLYRLLYIHYSHMKALLDSILWEWLHISWYFIAFQSAWQTFEVHHNVWQASTSMDNLFGININSNLHK